MNIVQVEDHDSDAMLIICHGCESDCYVRIEEQQPRKSKRDRKIYLIPAYSRAREGIRVSMERMRECKKAA